MQPTRSSVSSKTVKIVENPTVCAVVVSYRPPQELLKNVHLLLDQLPKVVVVDNKAGSNGTKVLGELEQLTDCTVIRNDRNLGIAAALNIGIRHAISMGYEWIVMLDQDSQIREGYVKKLLTTYHDISSRSAVGILCPRYQDARLGIFMHTHRAANGDIFSCMTSGSMIRAETFHAYGPMDELLFIDYVDLDYCFRLRTAGLKVIECPEAVLTHSLGRITKHKLLWKTFTTTNHSAKRRYYITRNRLVVMKRFFHQDREWVIADMKGMIVDAAKIFLVEKEKLAKAGYMLRALFDAVFNRLGQRVPL